MQIDRRTALGLGAAVVMTPSLAKPETLPDRDDYKWIIMPCISKIEVQNKTRYGNWWTIHYSWMHRCPQDNPLYGPTVHVNSRTYREWLAEGNYFSEDPRIPPHICFGGAVKAGPGDPTFKKRWEDYAAREFGFS